LVYHGLRSLSFSMSIAPLPRRGGRPRQVAPDLRQLKQLVAVIDHGSLNRAAVTLGIAQPTLSRSIARLEDQLRVRLFDRSGVALRPTYLGQLLAERARRLIGEANDLGHWLQMLSDGESGSVRLGFGPVPRAVFLARSLAAIVERFPNLKAEISLGSANPLFRQLQARDLDIAVVSGDDIASDSATDRIELMSVPFVAVARPDHPLAGRPRLTWRDLLPYALVEPSIAEDVRRVIDPDVVDAIVAATVICADFASIREMVQTGPYLSVAPEAVFAADLAAGRLVRIDLDIAARYTCVAVLHSESRSSPVLMSVVDLIRSAAQHCGTESSANGGS
jgi:DNA-binding transcriptional LysR family regulator